jgi:hypothetical protein
LAREASKIFADADDWMYESLAEQAIGMQPAVMIAGRQLH